MPGNPFARKPLAREFSGVPAALCRALALAALCGAGPALAADAIEAWPQVSAFINMKPDVRAFLDAAHAKGKEDNFRTSDFTAALDWSLEPWLRPSLQSQDWQRNRFLWLRGGYTYVVKADASLFPGDFENTEDRLHGAAMAKAILPAEVQMEGRFRVDMRWTDGEYATRYRFRLEVNREFIVAGQPMIAYGQAEAFYDTRYSGWSRGLLQAGVDLELSRAFRLELYVARQEAVLPSDWTTTALGVVAKFYR
jgi:hypothetical protein